MKTIIALLVVLLVGIGLFAMRNDGTVTVNNGTDQPATSTNSGGSQGPNAPVATSLIKVAAPLPNSTVNNPILVSGEARGNWYFEASFPIRVLDANGQQIGIGHAEAQGEWMTSEFVPFKATITYTSPRTETGTLVLEKDNPSGLPENADEVRVPIRFASVSPQASVSLR
jgi:hypothetical protein